MEGASLGHESAQTGRCRDGLLKREKFGSEPDTDKEARGAIEESQRLKPYRNGRRTQFTKPRGEALKFFRAGIAQKLESDVPRFRRCPAQAVFPGSKPRGDRRKLVDDCCDHGNSDKQAHMKIV